MTQKEIRVGIIGANAKASWAKVSHVPAINSLPGLRLAAVATRNEQSAREAAEAFGADRWFSDPFVMIRDERIDLVTIAVKVPAHRELVLAALDAGKAVYCEAARQGGFRQSEVTRTHCARHLNNGNFLLFFVICATFVLMAGKQKENPECLDLPKPIRPFATGRSTPAARRGRPRPGGKGGSSIC